MESRESYGQVTRDLLLFLGCYLHTRYLLERAGVVLMGGIVVCVPPGFRVYVESAISRMGYLSKKSGDRSTTASNYEGMYSVCNCGSNSASIFKFLASGCETLVLCVGVVPDFLVSYEHVIFLDEMEFQCFDVLELVKDWERFVAFSHEHPAEIIDAVRMYSKCRGSSVSQRELARVLEFTLVAYWCFLTYDGADYHLTFDETLSMFNELVLKSSEVDCDEDVLTEVTSCLSNFVREGAAVVGNIDRVEGSLINAVNEKKAILFDKQYYYIPDELFRESIRGLLPYISYPCIKTRLKNIGGLVCDGSINNFTTKKIVYNVYGVPLRLRFLKFNRAMIDDARHLCLSEYGR